MNKEERQEEKYFTKLEEVFEFKTELDTHLITHVFNPYADKLLRMELGDVLVTLIIIAMQLGIDLVECLDMAYDKIKDRKGVTRNGTCIKESDL